MLDPRLNVVRVEQHHAELSRVAVCLRGVSPETDPGRCAEPVPARALRWRLRLRRPSLRLRFVAALWRG